MLFNLEDKKAGSWLPSSETWFHVGSFGYIGLSRVRNDGVIYTVRWNDIHSDLIWNSKEYPPLYLGFEDC